MVLPDNTDFDAGACMGIPGLTALEAVHRCGNLAGKTVLIIGAASSVSHYAAQMAVQKGARVIGTVSSDVKAAHAVAAQRRPILTERRGIELRADDNTRCQQMLGSQRAPPPSEP